MMAHILQQKRHSKSITFKIVLFLFVIIGTKNANCQNIIANQDISWTVTENWSDPQKYVDIEFNIVMTNNIDNLSYDDIIFRYRKSIKDSWESAEISSNWTANITLEKKSVEQNTYEFLLYRPGKTPTESDVTTELIYADFTYSHVLGKHKFKAKTIPDIYNYDGRVLNWEIKFYTIENGSQNECYSTETTGIECIIDDYLLSTCEVDLIEAKLTNGDDFTTIKNISNATIQYTKIEPSTHKFTAVGYNEENISWTIVPYDEYNGECDHIKGNDISIEVNETDITGNCRYIKKIIAYIDGTDIKKIKKFSTDELIVYGSHDTEEDEITLYVKNYKDIENVEWNIKFVSGNGNDDRIVLNSERTEEDKHIYKIDDIPDNTNEIFVSVTEKNNTSEEIFFPIYEKLINITFEDPISQVNGSGSINDGEVTIHTDGGIRFNVDMELAELITDDGPQYTYTFTQNDKVIREDVVLDWPSVSLSGLSLYVGNNFIAVTVYKKLHDSFETKAVASKSTNVILLSPALPMELETHISPDESCRDVDEPVVIQIYNTSIEQKEYFYSVFKNGYNDGYIYNGMKDLPTDGDVNFTYSPSQDDEGPVYLIVRYSNETEGVVRTREEKIDLLFKKKTFSDEVTIVQPSFDFVVDYENIKPGDKIVLKDEFIRNGGEYSWDYKRKWYLDGDYAGQSTYNRNFTIQFDNDDKYVEDIDHEIALRLEYNPGNLKGCIDPWLSEPYTRTVTVGYGDNANKEIPAEGGDVYFDLNEEECKIITNSNNDFSRYKDIINEFYFDDNILHVNVKPNYSNEYITMDFGTQVPGSATQQNFRIVQQNKRTPDVHTVDNCMYAEKSKVDNKYIITNNQERTHNFSDLYEFSNNDIQSVDLEFLEEHLPYGRPLDYSRVSINGDKLYHFMAWNTVEDNYTPVYYQIDLYKFNQSENKWEFDHIFNNSDIAPKHPKAYGECMPYTVNFYEHNDNFIISYYRDLGKDGYVEDWQSMTIHTDEPNDISMPRIIKYIEKKEDGTYKEYDLSTALPYLKSSYNLIDYNRWILMRDIVHEDLGKHMQFNDNFLILASDSYAKIFVKDELKGWRWIYDREYDIKEENITPTPEAKEYGKIHCSLYENMFVYGGRLYTIENDPLMPQQFNISSVKIAPNSTINEGFLASFEDDKINVYEVSEKGNSYEFKSTALKQKYTLDAPSDFNTYHFVMTISDGRLVLLKEQWSLPNIYGSDDQYHCYSCTGDCNTYFFNLYTPNDELKVVPQTVHFEDVTLTGRDYSQTRTVKLYNSSFQPMQIHSIVPSSHKTEFSISYDIDYEIQPGETYQISITYTPYTIGKTDVQFIINYNTDKEAQFTAITNTTIKDSYITTDEGTPCSFQDIPCFDFNTPYNSISSTEVSGAIGYVYYINDNTYRVDKLANRLYLYGKGLELNTPNFIAVASVVMNNGHEVTGPKNFASINITANPRIFSTSNPLCTDNCIVTGRSETGTFSDFIIVDDFHFFEAFKWFVNGVEIPATDRRYFCPDHILTPTNQYWNCQHNQTYTITCQAQMPGNATWFESDAIIVTYIDETQALPEIRIGCNDVVSGKNAVFAASTGYPATEYLWTFASDQHSFEINKNTDDLSLFFPYIAYLDVPAATYIDIPLNMTTTPVSNKLNYETEYTISLSAIREGGDVTEPVSCTFNTVYPKSCVVNQNGAQIWQQTITKPNQNIYRRIVEGADRYRYNFIGASGTTSFEVEKGVSFILRPKIFSDYESSPQTLDYQTHYDVRIQVQINGQWLDNGDACDVYINYGFNRNKTYNRSLSIGNTNANLNIGGTQSNYRVSTKRATSDYIKSYEIKPDKYIDLIRPGTGSLALNMNTQSSGYIQTDTYILDGGGNFATQSEAEPLITDTTYQYALAFNNLTPETMYEMKIEVLIDSVWVDLSGWSKFMTLPFLNEGCSTIDLLNPSLTHFFGNWDINPDSIGYWGNGFAYTDSTIGNYISYELNVDSSGYYSVYALWPKINKLGRTLITVEHDKGTDTVYMNQADILFDQAFIGNYLLKDSTPGVVTFYQLSDTTVMVAGDVQYCLTSALDVPRIVSHKDLQFLSGQQLKIHLEDLIVQDEDNIYPDDFTMTIMAGDYYSVTGSTIVPDSGYFGYLQVPVTVNDGTHTSNQAILNVEVIENNLPDLGFIVCDSPSEMYLDENLHISSVYMNTGGYMFSSCKMSYYASSDSIIDTTDYCMGKSLIAPLNSYMYDTVNIESYLPIFMDQDEIFIIAVIDQSNELEELNKSNNIIHKKLKIKPARPDVSIDNIGVGSPSVEAGDSIFVQCDIYTGSKPISKPLDVIFYLSNDTILTANDKIISFEKLEPVASGETIQISTYANIPFSSTTGNNYIFCKVDAYDFLVEQNEENNTEHTVLQVMPSNPELTIHALTTDTVNITPGKYSFIKFELQNISQTEANNFVVNVYACHNNILDGTEELIFETSIDTLQAVSSTILSELIIVPQNKPVGLYHYIAVIDGNNSIPEKNELDNKALYCVNYNSVYDVQVSNMQANPDTVNQLHSNQISFDVINSGNSASGLGKCVLFMFPDCVYNSGIIPIDTLSFTNLSAGDSLHFDYTFNLPYHIHADTFNFCSMVYYDKDEFDINPGNNFDSVEINVNTKHPDLGINSLTCSTDSIIEGELLNIQYTVKNHGTDLSPSVPANMYLYHSYYRDTVLLLNSQNISSLQAGDSVVIDFQYNSPMNLKEGFYKLYVATDEDDVIFELSETNNLMYTDIFIRSSKPDLYIGNIVIDSTLIPGQLTNISADIINRGMNNAPANELNIYLSANSTVGQTDTLLSSVSLPNIAPEDTFRLNTSILIPVNYIIGKFKILLFADANNTINEVFEFNNTRTRLVNISGPDFITIEPQIFFQQGQDSAISTLQCSIVNIGNGNLEVPAKIDYFISRDSLLNYLDLYIGSAQINNLNANDTMQVIADITFPENINLNNFNIIYGTDAELKIIEEDEYNNYAVKNVEYNSIDIINNNIAVDDIQKTAGSDINITCTIEKQGISLYNLSSTVQLGIYLSDNLNIDDSDIILSEMNLINLFSGDTKTQNVNVSLPSDIQFGQHYIISKIKNTGSVFESDITNNTVNTSIEIVGPDLTPSGMSVSEPVSLHNDVVQVSMYIKNKGAFQSGTITNAKLYISANEMIDQYDTIINEMQISLISPNDSVLFTSDFTVSPSLSYGTYYFICQVDDNNDIYETNESNNQKVLTYQIASPNLVLHATIEHATQATMSDGNIYLDVSNGIPPYTYYWQNGDITKDLLDVPSGKYYVSVTDSRGNIKFDQYIVQQPIQLTLQPTHISVSGGSDASIVTSFYGVEPYRYEWTKIGDPSFYQTTKDLNNISSGIYHLIARDFLDSTRTVNVIINEPDTLSTLFDVTHVSVPYGNDGQIIIHPQGVAPYYQTRHLDVEFDTILTNLRSGAYNIIYYDANGQKYSNTIVVKQPLELNTTISPITYYNKSNGSIRAEAIGGNGDVIFNWYRNDTLLSYNINEIGNLYPATYISIISDETGQVALDTIHLTQPDTLHATVDVQHITALDANNGQVTIHATGGTSPYRYSVRGCYGQNDDIEYFGPDSIVSNLGQGYYWIYVKDAFDNIFDCGDVVVTEPMIVYTGDITNVSAFEANNGAIKNVYVEGGTYPITIAWTKMEEPGFLQEYECRSSDIANISGGHYILTVTDTLGAYFCDTLFVYEPQPLDLSASITHPSIFNGTDGSITVSPFGGNPPYTYSWRFCGINQVNFGEPHFSKDCPQLGAGVVEYFLYDSLNNSRRYRFDLIQPLSLFYETGDVTALGVSDGFIKDIYFNQGPVPRNIIITDSTGNILLDEMHDTYNSNRTFENLYGLPGGEYTLTLTDGIDSLTEVVVLHEPDVFHLDVERHDISTYGGNDASFDVTIYGGVLPHRYEWFYIQNNDESYYNYGEDLSGLSKGVATLRVWDDNNNQLYYQHWIYDPLYLSGYKIDPVSEYGLANGRIYNISLKGGNYHYNYALIDQNGDTIAQGNGTWGLINGFSGLSAGVYTLYLKDTQDEPFVLEREFTITQPNKFEFEVNKLNDVTTYGGNDGALKIELSGNPPFRIECDGFPGGGATGIQQSEMTFSNLQAGTYWIQVWDSMGLHGSQTAYIYEPFDVEVVSVENISSPGLNNGAIEVLAKGGAPPYSYSWSRNSYSYPGATSSINNLAAGTYGVIIYDANNEQTNRYFTISEPVVLSAQFSTNHVSSFGGNNGYITSIFSGNGPISVTWTKDNEFYADQANLSNLVPGTYVLHLEDSLHFTYTETVEIYQPMQLMAVDVHQISRHGLTDGSISVVIEGGHRQIQYQWFDKHQHLISTSESISGLQKGTYYLKVKDPATYQTIVEQYTITEPDPFELNIVDVQHPTTYNGTDGHIEIEITGGREPYSFEWAIQAPDGTLATNRYKNLYNVGAGTYTLLATDSAGVSAEKTIQINNPLIIKGAIVFDASAPGKNDGGIYFVEALGGAEPYTYSWQKNGASIQNSGPDAAKISAGQYIVTVNDDMGSTAKDTFYVNEPGGLNVVKNITQVSRPLASDGEIGLDILQGVPPFTYRWSWLNDNMAYMSTSDDALTGIPAGTYNLHIAGSDGQEGNYTYSVLNPSDIIYSEVENVSWPDSIDGELHVMFGDAEQYSNYICFKEGIIWAQGILDRVWLDFVNIPSGTYTIVLIDENNTITGNTFKVTEPVKLQSNINYQHITEYGGNDGKITINIQQANEPVTAWCRFVEHGDFKTIYGTELNNLSPNNYEVFIQDDSGQNNFFYVQLVEPLTITGQTVTDVSELYGNNGSVSVTVYGGSYPYTYKWLDDGGAVISTSSSVSNLKAGLYTVTVKDSKNRAITQSYEITQPEKLNVAFNYNHPTSYLANDGEISMTVSGGNPPYVFRSNQFSGFVKKDTAFSVQYENLKPGYYYLDIQDENYQYKTFNVNLHEPLEIQISRLEHCSVYGVNNGVISVEYTGGVSPMSFRWEKNGAYFSNNYRVISDLSAGEYRVVVTDSENNSKELSVTIQSPPAMEMDISLAHLHDSKINSGAVTAHIIGTPPYELKLFGAEWRNTSDTIIKDLPAGDYTLLTYDNSKQHIKTTFSITSPPEISYDMQQVSTPGGDDGSIYATISEGLAPFNYSWMKNGVYIADTKSISDLTKGVYEFIVTDALQRTAQTTVFVTEEAYNLSVLADVTHCSTDSTHDGSIQLTVSNGLAPYTYVWSNGENTSEISNLAPGIYTCVILDANQVNSSIVCSVNDGLSVETYLSYPGNGKININTIVSGTGPFSYYWYKNGNLLSADPIIYNAQPGRYVLSVIDTALNTVSKTVDIPYPGTLSFSANITNVSYGNPTSGAIDLSVQGGYPPYTFDWSNDAITEDIVNLSTGTYSVDIYDSIGNHASDNFIVPNDMKIVSMDVTDASMYGENDGGIVVHVFKNSGYEARWWKDDVLYTDVSYLTLHDLGPGSYKVEVTDAYGFVDFGLAEVTEPNQLVVDIEKNHISEPGGDDGSLIVHVLDGTPPYEVNFNNNGYIENDTIHDNLDSDYYFIKVKDATGQIFEMDYIFLSDSFRVRITYNNCTVKGCNDRYINLYPYGGNYSVSNFYNHVLCVKNGTDTISTNPPGSSYTYSNMSAGKYAFFITDNEGREFFDTIEITQPNDLSYRYEVTHASCKECNDGSVKFYIDESNGPVRIKGPNGTFTTTDTLFAYNNIGVEYEHKFTIYDIIYSQIEHITIGCPLIVEAICNFKPEDDYYEMHSDVRGGVLPIVLTFEKENNILKENTFYYYDGGSQLLLNEVSGEYAIIAHDAAGNVDTIAYNFDTLPPITFEVTTTNPSTYGGSDGRIDVNVLSGIPPYRVLRTNPSEINDLDNLKALRNYNVSVFDYYGQVFTFDTMLYHQIYLQPEVIQVSGRNASDGKITLYTKGGSFYFDLPRSYQYISLRENHFTYEWQKDGIDIPGGESIENLTRGTYTVLVTDPVGITKRDTFHITQPNNIPLITAQLPHTVYEDEFIPVTLDKLVVSDTDDTYPNDFSLHIVHDPDMLIFNDTIYPPNEFSGTLQVQLFVNDQWDNSDIFTYEITVLPVNDPPQILSHDYITLIEDSSFTFSLNDISFYDVDADSTTVFELLVNQGQKYSVTDYTVQPKSNYYGDLHIPVQVTDGLDTSGMYSVFVDVLPVNDVPQIVQVDTIVTENDIPVQLTVDRLEIYDPDDDPSSMSFIIYPGNHYSFVNDVITPEQHFVGELSVNCRICDGKDTSALFVVPIRVDFALPDFVVSSIDVPPTASVTDEIPLAFYMKNTGKPVSSGTSVNYKVYMSEGTDTTGAMYSSGSALFANANDSVEVSMQFSLSAISNTGGYIFTLIVDPSNTLDEYDEGNNMVQTNIQILPYDLALSGFTVPVNDIMPFVDYGFSVNISNAGPGTVPASQLSLVLSEDEQYDMGDEQIAVFDILLIEAGSSVSINENFTLLSSPDTAMKYMLCIIDEQGDLIETNEANNTAAQDITIKLPDLLVNNYQAPGTIHLGEDCLIEINFKNIGGTIVDSELFVLSACLSSQSTACSTALDAIDLTYSGLLSGDSVTEQLSFYVPDDAPPGIYFINISIDMYSAIDESNESNNTVSVPVTLNPPDLIISGFQCSGGIARGAENEFEFMIANNGNGNCPASTVGLYYSTDYMLDSSDEQISEFTIGYLPSGDSLSDIAPVFIDLYPDQDYTYIICKLDNDNRYPEPDESDNYFALPVDLAWPDISIFNTDMNDILVLNEPYTFDLSLINISGNCVSAENSNVSVYLTEHDNPANYYVHESYVIDPLNFGQQVTIYPELIVNNLQPGIYDIVIQLDATDNIQESDETNNTYVHQIEIETGDLLVQDITIPNLLVYNGLDIDLELLVANLGNGNIQNPEFIVFLSQDNVPLNGNDIFLTQIDYDDVMYSGDIMQLSTNCVIPPVVDTTYKYIIAIADETNSIIESDETNNIFIEPFRLRMPDLRITFSQVTDSMWPDEEFECNVIIKNIGNGVYNTGSLLDFGIYSNPDGTEYVEGGGNMELPHLAPGDSIEFPYFTVLDMFQPSGTYYCKVTINEEQLMREWSYENNALTQAFELRHVNREFSISNFEVNPAPVYSGDNISWQFDITYSGERMVYSPDVSVYLSEDDVFDIYEDQQIDYVVFEDMEDGDALTQTGNYTTNGLLTGEYFLFAIVDENDLYAEINEENNEFVRSFILTFNGNYPDMTLINFQAPDTIIQSSSYSFSFDIKNRGTSQAIEYDVFYFLSQDSMLSNDDEYLGYVNNEYEVWNDYEGIWEYFYDELNPNEINNKTFTKAFPANQPTGQWYIILKADYYNSTPELLEDNNMLILPLQINRRGPDLVIENLSVNYSSRLQGSNQYWTCDVKNIGNHEADTCEVYYYFSRDTIKSAEDIYAGSQDNELEGYNDYYDEYYYYYDEIHEGDSMNFNDNKYLPADFQPGQWYLLAIVDRDNQTHELDESNNMAHVPFEVIRRGPDLVIENLSVNYSSRLQGSNQYWTCDVKNIGNHEADTCEVYYYFSRDTIKSAEDIYAGHQDNELEEYDDYYEEYYYYYDEIYEGDSMNFNDNKYLPADFQPGQWYLLAIVDRDNQTHELDESNNMAYVPFEVIRRGPDLVIENLSVNYSSRLQGSSQYWTCDVKNIGNHEADTCEVYYYFSRDTIKSAEDIYAGYSDNWVEEYDEYYDEYVYYYENIYAGSNYSFSGYKWIDYNFGTGQWYLLAIVDRYENLQELEENNNISWSSFTVGDASKTKQKVYTGNYSPDEIEVFPNPVDENITILLPEIKHSDNNGFYSVTIFDNIGKQIEKIHIEQYAPLIEIDMSQYAKGIYYLNISNNKEFVIKKVIKMGE